MFMYAFALLPPCLCMNAPLPATPCPPLSPPPGPARPRSTPSPPPWPATWRPAVWRWWRCTRDTCAPSCRVRVRAIGAAGGSGGSEFFWGPGVCALLGGRCGSGEGRAVDLLCRRPRPHDPLVPSLAHLCTSARRHTSTPAHQRTSAPAHPTHQLPTRALGTTTAHTHTHTHRRQRVMFSLCSLTQAATAGSTRKRARRG